MAYEIKTIDQRIRAKANEDTRMRVALALDKAKDVARVGCDLKTEPGKPTVWECIGLIEVALINYHKPRDEETAIEDFLRQVDQLSEQVNELRTQVEG